MGKPPSSFFSPFTPSNSFFYRPYYFTPYHTFPAYRIQAKSPTLKRTGIYQRAMMLAAVEPITNILYTQILQKSVEETAAVMAGVRKEMVDPGVRVYNEYWFIVGRKPVV